MNTLPKACGLCRRLLLAGLLVSLMGLAQVFAGPEPAWWSSVKSGAPASDYAIANQGQAKWFALKAEAELRAKLPAPFNGPILSTLPPGNNYLAINQGQLKNLVKPLYDQIHLAAQTYPYLLQTLPLNIPGFYPWTDAATDDKNYAPVNLGQLKYVFSFDFYRLPVTLTASCRPNRIVLNWDVPLDTIPHVLNYVIKRSIVHGGPYTEIDTLTSSQQYIDASVVAGATYYYVVVMHTDDGAESYSNEGAASTCHTPITGPVDIAFIIDNTSSMSSSLTQVTKTIAGVLHDIHVASGSNYRLALVSPDNDQVHVRVNFAQNNESDFLQALLSLPPADGGRTPESTDQCLNTVVNALPDDAHGRTDSENCKGSSLQIGSFTPAFRADATRLIVLITDATPGGFCDPSDFDPDVDAPRAHQYALDAANRGIQIDAILLDDNYADTYAAVPVMQDYAQTTCGWYSLVNRTGTGINDAILQMFYSAAPCSIQGNTRPIADAKIVNVAVNVPQIITLTGSDPHHLPLNFTLVTPPTHGNFQNTTPPNLTYKPDHDYVGLDSFTFKVNNGTLDSLPATVSINVDNPPVAISQSITVAQNTSYVVSLQGTDADGNPLSYSVSAYPLHGNLIGTPPNIIYTPPDPGFTGSDSFTFKVNDGIFDSAVATVSINVISAGITITTQPHDQTILTGPNATAMFSVVATGTGLNYQWYDEYGSPLYNDGITPGGATLSGALTTHLTLTGVTSGDSGHKYYVQVYNTVGGVNSLSATLYVADPGVPVITTQPRSINTIIGANVQFSVAINPSAPPTTYQWYKDTGLNIGPLAGKTASSLLLQSVQAGDAGTYHVLITNPYGNTPSDVVSLAIAQVPLPQVVFTPSSSGASPTTVKLSVPGHPPNPTIYYTLNGSIPNTSSSQYTGPILLNGKTTLSAYTRENNMDSGYTVATFGDASAPAAVPDIFSLQQGDPATQFDVLANDANPSADTLNITILKQPQHALVTPGSTDVTYTPDGSGFFGIDSFTYQITDSQGNKSATTATVFVNNSNNNGNGVNNAPVTADDSPDPLPVHFYTATINLLANDIDPDNDGLAIYSIDAPSMGTVVNNGGGQITYTRDPSKYGSDSFAYVVTDGNGGYAIGTIMIDQIDSDGDGLPDEWEMFYLHTLNYGPLDDPDNDHFPNWAEFRLGTNPNVPDNPLGISGVGQPNSSGISTMQLNINPDAYPDADFTLLVDGVETDALIHKAGSSWVADWDTATTPNGNHKLSLSYSTSIITETSSDPIVGPTSDVTVANVITLDEATRWFTDQLNINAHVNVSANYYRLEIFDASTGSHLNTLAGTVVGNTIQTNWDLKDSSGTIIADGPLNIVFYTSLNAGNLGAAPAIIIGGDPQTETKRYKRSKRISRKSYAIAFGYDFNVSDLGDMMLQGVVDKLDTLADIYGDGTDYSLLPNMPGGNVPYACSFQWNSLSTPVLLISLLQGGNFYWWGHGGPGAISPSTNGVPLIRAKEAARILGNDGWNGKFNSPYRLVILDCCSAFSRKWANAFGFPDLGNNNLLDYTRLQADPQAFIAWRCRIRAPGDKTGIAWSAYCLEILNSEWQLGIPIDKCMQDYTSALAWRLFEDDNHNGVPDIMEFRISGCVDLNSTFR
jgi:Bacterial Ig domain/Chitobiase/beta-hexosaminidase C-terminal domain/Immunoglobulin domain/von Willebrand factor type A domain